MLDIGSLYTTMSSSGELFRIPNASVMSSVLVASHKPLRADVELDIPAQTSLRSLEQQVRRRLPLQADAIVLVVPARYSKLEGESRATIRLRIRTDEWLEPDDVIRAIDEALHVDGSTAENGAGQASGRPGRDLPGPAAGAHASGTGDSHTPTTPPSPAAAPHSDR